METGISDSGIMNDGTIDSVTRPQSAAVQVGQHTKRCHAAHDSAFNNITRQLLIVLSALLLACEHDTPTTAGPQYSAQPPASAALVYTIAVHPLHNPARLMQTYQPLISYLNRNFTDARFELEASRDYQAFEAKFRARSAAFLLPNPWQTLQAMKVGYAVIAEAGDSDDFTGLFIVRNDSDIRQPADLKGRVISYPSPTALAACILPQDYLHDQGINVMKDIDNRYVGSQESSIMHAYLGQSAVGVTWPPPWRAFQKDHPEEAAQLRVLWTTPPLMNNSFMVRDDVPDEVRARVQALLLSLHRSDLGRNILEDMQTARFNPADNGSYAPVRDFIARFEREVRPVEQP